MRAVLDTNVLLSGLFWRGAPDHIFIITQWEHQLRGRAMTRLVRIVAFVSGLGLVALVSGTFLWEHGARGLAVPLGAALGALIAMLASQALFRRVMMGGASIVGGIVGSAAGESAVSESGVMAYTNSGIPMAPSY